jgi:predicted phage terminase large subunit-like protein
MADKIQFTLQPKQEEFCSSSADIVFFGGSAGGGKSYATILECCRHVNVPGFGAVIFRREMTQIKQQGGIWDESCGMYPYMGAKPNLSERYWQFPAGPRIQMAGMERAEDRFKWQGSAIALICFEEVTHFVASQFWYMLSRNRSTCGVRPYIRATCNPDADSWVRPLIDWWIGPDGYAIEARSGVIRYFVRIGETITWGDTRDELMEIEGVDPVDIKSFTFIRSKLQDNQALLKANPEYLGNLKALGPVERQRLLDGNWNIRPSAGLYFRREWFHEIERAPDGLQDVRAWDLASTTAQENKNADKTTSVKMGKDKEGRIYIHHAEAIMASPNQVREQIKRRANEDGRACQISIPKDPGQAGKAQAQDLVAMLSGYSVRATPRTGSKTNYASPFSAQVEAGNVYIVKGLWNDEFYNELENFPEGAHDDLVDASSDAFNMLVRTNRELKIA